MQILCKWYTRTSRGQQIEHVWCRIVAPYNNIIDTQLGGDGRVKVWKEELDKINPPNAISEDFRFVFNEKNSDDYCYDVIHLNHAGAVLFSEALGDYLKKNMNQLIEREKR